MIIFDKDRGIDFTNVKEISKGTIGGYSIEVEEISPVAFSSYIYKTEEERDRDYELCVTTLNLG